MSKLFSIASALRLSLIALVLVAAGFVGSGSAHAALTYCRTDPSITLSNGRVVTLEADISDYAQYVTSVDYTLHIPAGLTATSIHTDTATTGITENVTVRSDAGTNTYAASTKVNDVHVVNVTAIETVSYNGNSGQQTSYGSTLAAIQTTVYFA